MTPAVRQYLGVTGCYWTFTLTDGALRMLVLLYFYGLGYSPLQVAMLFLLYEFFGVVTNLLGGWLAARAGLNFTLRAGLLLQVLALSMLLVDASLLSVAYVMIAQALSGIAKDLNKMSAKSSLKTLVAADAPRRLYRWVALLTGSKNALKGIGFFVGAVLLSWIGFKGAIAVLAGLLLLVLLASLIWLKLDDSSVRYKPTFSDIFSKSKAVNQLSMARFFLFGARDVWFVVALPVFLQSQLQWRHTQVGSLLAVWIIGYGIVQSFAPAITGQGAGKGSCGGVSAKVPKWGGALCVVPIVFAGALYCGVDAGHCIVFGLLAFGALFAVNSALHSYLIIAYARVEGVSLDVGFYYMANAAGRLIGTVLSGGIYQWFGFEICLLVSAFFIAVASLVSIKLPDAAPQATTV